MGIGDGRLGQRCRERFPTDVVKSSDLRMPFHVGLARKDEYFQRFGFGPGDGDADRKKPGDECGE